MILNAAVVVSIQAQINDFKCCCFLFFLKQAFFSLKIITAQQNVYMPEFVFSIVLLDVYLKFIIVGQGLNLQPLVNK